MSRFVALIVVWNILIVSNLQAKDAPVQDAISKGLKRLEEAAKNYPKHRQCFSCHHQAVPLMAFASAKTKGLEVDQKLIKDQIEFTLQTFREKVKEIREGKSVPGGNTMSAYALHTLRVSDYPSDEITGALVDFLLIRQKSDGSWPALASRPPTEGSKFTNAFFALSSLEKYSPSKPIKEGEEKEIQERLDRARKNGIDWLTQEEPKSMEDWVFLLRALVVSKAPTEKMKEVRKKLIKQQNEDGSWSQLPELKGDAYATGTVMIALRDAGMKPEDPIYQKGVEYLLKSQDKSGAWIVQTRSRPVQTYFDNGDPGGKSQFISVSATGWATMALLETIPGK
jgi:N-acyl-D-amino-acid deacylase